MPVWQLWRGCNAVAIGPLFDAVLSRLSDKALLELLRDVARIAVTYFLIVYLQPWNSAIEKVQIVQIREQIVRDEQILQGMGCSEAGPNTVKFAACTRLKLDIEINRDKLKRETHISPMANATAQVGS